MSAFLLAYVSGALGVTYALMVWFNTGFPIHMTAVLRAIGIGGDVWDGYEDTAPTTKDELDAYLISKVGLPLWLELLCCPVCLSFHLSWILATTICVVAPVSWWLVPAAVLSWPAVANILFHFVSQTNTTSDK